MLHTVSYFALQEQEIQALEDKSFGRPIALAASEGHQVVEQRPHGRSMVSIPFSGQAVLISDLAGILRRFLGTRYERPMVSFVVNQGSYP